MQNRLRRIVFSALATLLLITDATLWSSELDRPNIIFILADDQRADQLSCAGHPVLRTPAIDSLARQGVRFRNAFVTTSICAASRATLLTGQWERTHGYTFGRPAFSQETASKTYPALLRDAGYRCGFIGKLGVAFQRGSDQIMFDFFRPLSRNPYIKTLPDGSQRHITDICGDFAEEFLMESADAEAPFCLSISFNAPHAEDSDKEDHYPPPAGVANLYSEVTMPRPLLDDPSIFESQPDFLKESLNRVRYFWRWDTAEKYDKNYRNYLRMLTGIDRTVRRVMDALQAHDLANNTVVIYSADNGYYLAERGFAGKWSHYEQSLRIPLIIADPRRNPECQGRVLPAMVLNVDIPATILELAGIEADSSFQGQSLVTLCGAAPDESLRDDFFCEHLMNHARIPKWEGVRGKRWVYARYFQQEPPHEFLHDLQTDPHQLRNLVGDAAYHEKLDALRVRCDELRDSLGGRYPDNLP